MEQQTNQGFQYVYSAKEQEEVRAIREKYLSTKEDKLERLRRIDAETTKKAVAVSVAVGTAGALVMGAGMSLVMTDIGNTVGLSNSLPVGILIGLIGMAVAGIAYPIYRCMVRKARAKAAPEILRLTDELMK